MLKLIKKISKQLITGIRLTYKQIKKFILQIF